MRLFATISAVVALSVPAHLCAQAPSTQQRSILTSGSVVGLYLEGELQFIRASGTPSHESSEELTPAHFFAYPALTNIMLAATVRALDAAGQLDASAPLSSFVNGASEHLADVSLDQLLTHSAGLNDAVPPPDFDWSRVLTDLPDEVILTEAGVIPSISRYSYPVVAQVLERLTGLPVTDVITAAILSPLGMGRSTFDITMAEAGGLAKGYERTRSGSNPVALVEPAETLEGLPVLYTTAPDVVQFAVAWMGGAMQGAGPVPQDQNRIPAAGRKLPWDGVLVERYQGTLRTSLILDEAGFGTVLQIFPEQSSILFAWANGAAPVDALENEEMLLHSTMGVQPPLAATSGTLPPAEDWVGTYQNGARAVTIRADGDGMAIFDGVQELDVTPMANQVLAAVVDGRRVAFMFRLEEVGGRRFVLLGNRAFEYQGPER